MKVHNIIFCTGYVESNSIGCVILQNMDGFDSVEEALQSLGQSFLDALTIEQEECGDFCYNCRSSLKVDKDTHICGGCNANLSRDPIDEEELAEYICEYLNGTIDGTHTVWEELTSRGWEQWGYSKETDLNNIVTIYENGDLAIAKAAFGRMFIEYPTKEYSERLTWLKSTARREAVNNMTIPKGMKVFLDD